MNASFEFLLFVSERLRVALLAFCLILSIRIGCAQLAPAAPSSAGPSVVAALPQP